MLQEGKTDTNATWNVSGKFQSPRRGGLDSRGKFGFVPRQPP